MIWQVIFITGATLSSGFLGWGFFTVVEALVGIHAELTEMNRLTRDQWSSDYKTGRIEKPERKAA